MILGKESNMRSAVAVLCLVVSGCGPTLDFTPRAVFCGVTQGVQVYSDDGGSCQAGLELVPKTISKGIELGLWDGGTRWNFSLEFVGTIHEVGLSGYNGVTLGSRMVLTSTDAWLAGHEFIHEVYGEADHCHWASRYQADIKAFGGGSGGKYVDACERKICWEGNFWDCDPVRP